MAVITTSTTSRRRRHTERRRTVSTLLIVTIAAVLLVATLLVVLLPAVWNKDANVDADTGGNMLRGSEAERKAVGLINQKEYADETVAVLSLQLVDGDSTNTVDIRMRLFADQAPEATKFIRAMAANTDQTCTKCTLYRGEPVPSYWGSNEYPDRYFDGGRWGPPYALVQGGLIPVTVGDSSPSIPIPPAESHHPIIERGMVAWAGGKGGPHFFVALARHPEWGHEHTVFATVAEEDMDKVDALLSRPLVSTKPKRPPIVTNFVDPIPFRIRMQ